MGAASAKKKAAGYEAAAIKRKQSRSKLGSV